MSEVQARFVRVHADEAGLQRCQKKDAVHATATRRTTSLPPQMNSDLEPQMNSNHRLAGMLTSCLRCACALSSALQPSSAPPDLDLHTRTLTDALESIRANIHDDANSRGDADLDSHAASSDADYEFDTAASCLKALIMAATLLPDIRRFQSVACAIVALHHATTKHGDGNTISKAMTKRGFEFVVMPSVGAVANAASSPEVSSEGSCVRGLTELYTMLKSRGALVPHDNDAQWQFWHQVASSTRLPEWHMNRRTFAGLQQQMRLAYATHPAALSAYAAMFCAGGTATFTNHDGRRMTVLLPPATLPRKSKEPTTPAAPALQSRRDICHIVRTVAGDLGVVLVNEPNQPKP